MSFDIFGDIISPIMPETHLEEMKIGLEGIGHALSDRMLSVPNFQRSYAWKEANVLALCQDIHKAMTDNSKEYFLGSVVAATKNDVNEIVDGQQRIATTAIIIAAVRDHFFHNQDVDRAQDIEQKYLISRHLRTQELSPRIKLNATDAEFFRQAVLVSPNQSMRQSATPQKDSHRRILEAFTTAKEFISSIVKVSSNATDVLVSLVEYLEHSAKVIWVRVADHANAFTIFETLNDRGLDLAISDLLKNFLFLLAKDRIEEVQQNWTSMNATIESVAEESVIVDFIRHYWSSRYGSTRERELYADIKKRVTSKQASIDLSVALAANAKSYAAILNTDHELWKTYGPTAKAHMSTLNLLQMVQIRPLILAVLDNFEVKEIKKSLKLMVSWAVRFLVFGGLGGGTLEKHYCDAAVAVRNGKVKTAKQLQEMLKNVVPSDKAFETSFATASVSKSPLARYYLSSLELAKANDRNPELIPNSNQDEVNLEHVLPQNPGQGWSHVNPESQKAYYNRIGNLVLLKADENSLIGNESFSVKKPVLKQSAYKLTSELAKQTRWDISQIEERQRLLAQLAVKAWSLKV